MLKKELFITCSKGNENILSKELFLMGFHNNKPSFRGVKINLKNEDYMTAIYKINYKTRIGIRVLLPLKKFQCFNKKNLYEHIKEIEWKQIIAKGKTFCVDAIIKQKHNEFNNEIFVSQVVKDCIVDQLKEKYNFRPNVDIKNPDIRLHIRIQPPQNDKYQQDIEDEYCSVISIDTSNISLSKRGYRKQTIAAPLQETLASSLLFMTEYSEKQNILCDPCCGSGTFLIEAAMMSMNIPAGFLRSRFGFIHMNEFSQKKWLEIKNEEDSKIIPLKENTIFGNDIDKNAIETFFQNIKLFDEKFKQKILFSKLIKISNESLIHYQPPIKPNFLITNPPYGERIGKNFDELIKLYRALGDFMKNKCEKPGKGYILTINNELSKQIGLKVKKRHIINNGGIDSRLLEFDIFEGKLL